MDGIKVTVKYGVSPSDNVIYLATDRKDFTKIVVNGETLRMEFKETLWSSQTYTLLDRPSKYIRGGTEAIAFAGEDPTPPPVTFKTTTERRKVIIPIPHEVKIEKLSSKDTDFENYIPGKEGSKVEVYEVKTYSDGKREERKLGEEDVVQPVPNVRQIGTKEKVPISPEEPPNYPKAEGNVKWYRQKIEYDDGTIEYTKAWRDGVDGQNGTQGADGKSSYLHIAYADDGYGGGFSFSPEGNKKYLGTYTDSKPQASYDYTKYTWARIKGEDGKDADYTQFRSEYSSELSQLKDSISSKVSQSVYDQKNREVEKRISTVEQKSDSYALEVSTVKRNLDTKTDTSDVKRIFSRLELTPEQITAVTKTFDIRGALKAYTGEIGPFVIGEFWGGYGPWITTKNWQVGMGGGSDNSHDVALWVNWGNNWHKPGLKSWYIRKNGRMIANNGCYMEGNIRMGGLEMFTFKDSAGFRKNSNVGLTMGGQENDVWYYYNGAIYSLWNAVKNASSDRKLKENIVDTKHKALDTIKELKFKEYDWIEGKFHQKHTKIGTIAQEVQKIDDSLVFEDGDILKLDVLRLANLALKGVQELSLENKKLKDEIAEIKQMLEEMKNEKTND